MALLQIILIIKWLVDMNSELVKELYARLPELLAHRVMMLAWDANFSVLFGREVKALTLANALFEHCSSLDELEKLSLNPKLIENLNLPSGLEIDSAQFSFAKNLAKEIFQDVNAGFDIDDVDEKKLLNSKVMLLEDVCFFPSKKSDPIAIPRIGYINSYIEDLRIVDVDDDD